MMVALASHSGLLCAVVLWSSLLACQPLNLKLFFG